jgi:hypothetical protein
LTGQRDERAALVLVELRAEIQRMYSGVISIHNDKVLGLAEQLSPLDDLPFLRRKRNSQLVTFLPYNRSCF